MGTQNKNNVTSKIFVWAGMLLLGSWMSSCSEQELPRTERQASDENSVPKGERNEDGSQSEDSPAKTKTPDESNIPPYLLKISEAKKLSHTSKFYRASAEERRRHIESSAPADEVREIAEMIKVFADQVSALIRGDKEAKFQVIGEKSAYYNAFSFYEYLTFNTPALMSKEGLVTLTTLCHEISHSLLGHSHFDASVGAEMIDLEKNEANKKLGQMIELYLASTYKKAKHTYTHDSTKYQALRKQAELAYKDYSVYMRRGESEADVLGAKVCARAGLSVEEYQRGQKLKVSLNGGSDGGAKGYGDDFKNGEIIQLYKDEDPFYFVLDSLPLATHPSDQERQEQLKRLADVLPTSSRESLAKTFLQDSSTMMASLRNRYPSGLALHDSARPFPTQLCGRGLPPFPGKPRPPRITSRE